MRVCVCVWGGGGGGGQQEKASNFFKASVRLYTE